MSSLSERLREKGVDMETERKLEQVCVHMCHNQHVYTVNQTAGDNKFVSRDCNVAVKFKICAVVNIVFSAAAVNDI